MTTIELDEMQRNLDRAIDTFDAEKKKLYRPDGSSKYSPQEHKEREAELFAPIQQAAERARAAAKEAQEEADRDDLIADFDPLLTLSGKQSDVIAVKQSIVSSYVEAASLPELARRINAVAVHGDEIDRRLYALHAHKRLEALQRQIHRSRGNAPEGFGLSAGALHKLRATLVDKETEKKLAAAKYRRQRAEELSIHVMRRLNEASGKTEQARREFAQRVRAML